MKPNGCVRDVFSEALVVVARSRKDVPSAVRAAPRDALEDVKYLNSILSLISHYLFLSLIWILGEKEIQLCVQKIDYYDRLISLDIS
jgi:hypothetical protein